MIRDRTEKTSIGFSANVLSKSEKRNIDILLQSIEPEDLIKFGLIPEFVGRLPILATLTELNEAVLVQVLTEPKNALIKQYSKLFEMENVKLEFRDEAIKAIAHKAMERKTGARGLRSILEHILLDTMYELPTAKGLQRVVIDESVVKGETKPLLIYEKEKQKRSA